MKTEGIGSIVEPLLPPQRAVSIQLRPLITAISLFTGVVFKVDTLLFTRVRDREWCLFVFVYACLSEHSKCGRVTTTSDGADGTGGAGGAGRNSNTSAHARVIFASFLFVVISISCFFG